MDYIYISKLVGFGLVLIKCLFVAFSYFGLDLSRYVFSEGERRLREVEVFERLKGLSVDDKGKLSIEVIERNLSLIAMIVRSEYKIFNLKANEVFLFLNQDKAFFYIKDYMKSKTIFSSINISENGVFFEMGRELKSKLVISAYKILFDFSCLMLCFFVIYHIKDFYYLLSPVLEIGFGGVFCLMFLFVVSLIVIYTIYLKHQSVSMAFLIVCDFKNVKYDKDE